MLHLYDRAAMARALTLELDPRLHQILVERIAALDTDFGDLTDWTEFVVVEPGDSEADLVRTAGFSPMVDPIDGGRYGDDGWSPGFDYLADRHGYYEIVTTFGSTFAYVLLIADSDGVLDELRQMCRWYADHSG